MARSPIDFFRPLLCAVQHAQDTDGFTGDPIGGDVRRAIDDQLACSLNASWPSHPRHLNKGLDTVFNPIVDEDRGVRAIRFDVIENCDSIGESKDRPFKIHELAFSLLPCGRTPPRKMRLHLILGNRGAWIIQRFLDSRAKPCIMFSGILCEGERKSAFIGRPCQQNSYRIRNRNT
jgi:hypothetical protein